MTFYRLTALLTFIMGKLVVIVLGRKKVSYVTIYGIGFVGMDLVLDLPG